MAEPHAGRVYLVGGGPGDPGLITVRGAELLGRADVVVHDRLVNPDLLGLTPPQAEVIDVGKRPGGPAHRQDDINALLVQRARAGKVVVRLKGGDPFVFGRGGEELAALLDAGIEAEVVPGVTSAVAVPAYAGIPVTHRGLATSVTVVTGHVGDPSVPGGVDWAALARAGGTLVVLMGMENRAQIASQLMEAGFKFDTPVAAVQWGTTPRQKTVRTTLEKLHALDLDPPVTLVIGSVASTEMGWFEHRPLHGIDVVITRPRDQAHSLAAALSQAGAEVVHLPLTKIGDPMDQGAALRKVLQDISGFKWLVLTSANAAERTLAGLKDGRSLGAVQVAVVGQATADVLRRHWIEPDLVAPGSTAASLVEAMPDAPARRSPRDEHPISVPVGARGEAVLFPRAADDSGVVGPGLRAKGWEVTEVEAYQTIPLGPRDEGGPQPDQLARAFSARAVTFAAGSAVRAFCQLSQTHDSAHETRGRRLRPEVAACIGPSTAKAAMAAGFPTVLQAPEPTVSGLVACLIERFRP